MTKIVFHHDHTHLPPASESILPVQLYGLTGQQRGDISTIGNPIIEKIKRLGVQISPQVMDFLSIALAITAADTFVRREDATDGWSRQLSIELPLYEPDRWISLAENLRTTFCFLSGDLWEFEFGRGGYSPPDPYRRRDRFELLKLNELDCVSLFSGGLDSAIGAIDLLNDGRKPLLVSHSYTRDKTHQYIIAQSLTGRHSRFAVNAHPVSANAPPDTTMRTRSCNFLAFGAIAANAVKIINQLDLVDLFVPENGFISLNAPLTTRRIGSLSTRTTHPYFLSLLQGIFDAVEIPCLIKNPYRFKTKGEMASNCKDSQLLNKIVNDTVSCGHWKRSGKQCGYCLPCTIRRAALHVGKIKENNGYFYKNITKVLSDPKKRDDVLALCAAIEQRKNRKIGSWISDSGPLPPQYYKDYQMVFLRGLDEVNNYFKAVGIL